MTQQPVYIDPHSKHQRLSLSGELTKLPSRPAQVPAEDQMTAALAWLADHSEKLARALCDLFLERDDEEARDALSRSTSVGADVQLRLPSIGAGFLWADLSLAGADRALKMLVEVKLGSEFHQYAIPALGKTLAQPDAYLHAWRSCDEAHEAKVRRLATLTLDGVAPRAEDPWRARDVTWGDIHKLLHEITGELSPQVEFVARDLRNHLASRVLPPVLSPGFLERGGKLTRGVCERLQARVSEGKLSGNFAANERFHYAGGYLQFTSPEQTREKLWFVVTPAGGDYNVPGAPAGIQMASVYEDPLTPAAKARLISAGFTETKDKIGYRLVRAALPLDEIEVETTLADQIAVASTWAEELLWAAGFVPDRTG
jgi:hypothetical protein